MRMKSIRFGYVVPVLASALLAMSCRYYLISTDILRIRAEAFDFQKYIDAQNLEVDARRQQLQSQETKLARGAALSESVGPAVVRDTVALAEKPVNVRLRELLQRHGVQFGGRGAADVGSQSERKGGN